MDQLKSTLELCLMIPDNRRAWAFMSTSTSYMIMMPAPCMHIRRVTVTSRCHWPAWCHGASSSLTQAAAQCATHAHPMSHRYDGRASCRTLWYITIETPKPKRLLSSIEHWFTRWDHLQLYCSRHLARHDINITYSVGHWALSWQCAGIAHCHPIALLLFSCHPVLVCRGKNCLNHQYWDTFPHL